MPYEELADFLADAEKAGELVRVETEVDPVLEIGAVTQRLSAAEEGGPAILFERVRGANFPVVTNLLGSAWRLSRALGADSLAAVEQRIEQMLHPPLAEGWLGSLKLLPQLMELTRMPPRRVKTGRSQQVVRIGRDIDLRELPFLQCWPKERAPSVTAAAVFTRHPETGERHVGHCPFSLRGQDALAVHWTPQDVAYRHFEGYRREGRQMPVALVLGGDPVLPLLARAPLPRETDACLLAGYFRGSNVELVKARTTELEVSADADVILEGVIDPAAETEITGPVALSTGFYSLPEETPTMNVTAVTHRSNPVVPAFVPGPPPNEQTWINRGLLHLLRPVVRLFVPEIVDLHCPAAGPDRQFVFVSLRKDYPHAVRKVVHALWGLHGLTRSKCIVVVDAEVDVRNEAAVWFEVGANVHPGRDVFFAEGPASFRDHAAPLPGRGHRMGIDATSKDKTDNHPRSWPEQLRFSRQMKELLEQRWETYGLQRRRNG